MKQSNLLSGYTIIISIFLIIEGIWGMFSTTVFGVLTTNTLHASIHILLGIIGIYTGLKGGARSFCIFFGSLVVLVGILRFVPGADDLVIKLLNVNVAVAYFNIIVGVISILIAMSAKGRAV